MPPIPFDSLREPTNKDLLLHPLAWLDGELIERELIRIGNTKEAAHRAALLAFWATVEGKLPSIRLPTPVEGGKVILRPIVESVREAAATTTRYVFLAVLMIGVYGVYRLTRK